MLFCNFLLVDLLDGKSQNSLQSPGVSQSTNDSKLLSTCEVAVERLYPDKVAVNEEIERIQPEEDHFTEPCSIAETRSLQPEAAVVVSSVCKTVGQECTGTCVAAAAIKDEQQEPDDCFGNIDFDPSCPLDDLCPSSDVELSDILELAASVSGSAGGMADLLTLDSVSEDLTTSKHDIPRSSSPPPSSLSSESLSFTLKLYSEMKHALLDPINIFDGSWPETFLSRWGGHLEGKNFTLKLSLSVRIFFYKSFGNWVLKIAKF